MMYRLSLSKPSALPSNELDDSWVQEIDMVRGESSKKTSKVGGTFITSAYNELLQAQAAAKPKRKKKKTGQGEVALPVHPATATRTRAHLMVTNITLQALAMGAREDN
ncbi:hypothetical protein H257_15681 [Aphanomyces astaci]|uniref:Uncharacterized protein n=1 Tax=Aphanomyces astaci TaxID=112090 RepID=W4FLJ7_APHAT|nr:hypothetical protein H257_15681 [Aphanomyces astaci]ETV68360.1 hypothetical protein H257_15681 [Aphanomyces astaci]|eukprot:XP_009842155.1 hypothetical protein H257_15681 [Aphanomyces astaci]